jgi:hypothetical protein
MSAPAPQTPERCPWCGGALEEGTVVSREILRWQGETRTVPLRGRRRPLFWPAYPGRYCPGCKRVILEAD